MKRNKNKIIKDKQEIIDELEANIKKLMEK